MLAEVRRLVALESMAWLTLAADVSFWSGWKTRGSLESQAAAAAAAQLASAKGHRCSASLEAVALALQERAR